MGQVGASASHQVYVIAPIGQRPVKVGVSINPRSRISALQTGHPSKLFLFHTIRLQREDAFMAEHIFHDSGEGTTLLEGEWHDVDVRYAIEQLQFIISGMATR